MNDEISAGYENASSATLKVAAEIMSCMKRFQICWNGENVWMN